MVGASRVSTIRGVGTFGVGGSGVTGLTLDQTIAQIVGVQPTITANLANNTAWVRGAPYALASVPGWSFSRALAAYGQRPDGTLQSFASGAPRLVNGRGQLIEGARTNLLLQSGFAGGGAVPTSWTQPVATGTSTPSTSTKNPDVVAYTQSATAQRPFFNQAVTFVSNTTYTVSFYIEEVTGTFALADIMTVVSLPSGCTGVGDGLGNLVAGQRRTIVYSGTYTGAVVQFRVGLGVNGNVTGSVRFSMPQVEAGAFPSSFISTTTTSLTRPADIPLIDISAYSPAITYPLTMYARFERVVDTGGAEVFLCISSDGTNTDRATLQVASDDVFQCDIHAGGVQQAALRPAGALSIGVAYKGAFRIASNDAIAARSGILSAQDTSVTVPAAPGRITLSARPDGAIPSFGYLSEFAIIPGAVSDANLVRLTA